MSARDPVKTAGAGIMLVGAGLGFARGGWAAMRARPPGPAAGGASPLPSATPALAMRLVHGAMALFGAFAFVCGLLLLLSLLISE